jgi:hypothetical protein
MPARRCSPGRRPKNTSNGSLGACATVSVWTVTTAGATRAAAVTMAVRRDPSTAAAAAGAGAGAGVGRRAAAGTSPPDGRALPWADESAGAPWQPSAAASASSDGRGARIRPRRSGAGRGP